MMQTEAAREAGLHSMPVEDRDTTQLHPLLVLLFLLSGATGLIYELVWTRELVFVFGGTTHAISTVLVAFMGGLGLGCWLAGRVCARFAYPGRVYGYLEIAIGLFGLATPLLLHLAEPLYRALYPHAQQTPWLLTAVRFLVGAIVLLLPTTMMGATLPILVRYVTRGRDAAVRSVGLLYGINTLGAVLGTLAAGFVLIPQLGLSTTTRTAAAINVGIGVTAVLVLRTRAERGVPVAITEPRTAVSVSPRDASPITGDMSRGVLGEAGHRLKTGATPPIARGTLRVVLVAFAVSGFAAMVYQISWTRALLLSIGSSTYSFTCILAAFVFGLALGSLASARFVDRWKNPLLVAGVTQILIGLTGVLLTPALGFAPLVVHELVQSLHRSYEALLAVEFALVIALTLVPTALMGALFPLVTRMVASASGDAAAATGRAYAFNTIGTILGAFLAGFFLIRGAWRFDFDGTLVGSSGIGAQGSILIAAGLNAASGAILICLAGRMGRAAWRRAIPALAATVCVISAGWLSARWDKDYLCSGPFRKDLSPYAVKQNAAVVYLADGIDMTVGVARSRHDPLTWALTVNGKPDASTAAEDMGTQILLGHIPMLLHPDARRVCVIGLGSGMSLSACARHPQVERMDCIEISEEVIAANEFFAPFTYDVLRRDSRVQTVLADGRNHLLLTNQAYDVIISEPSNPWIAGVSTLFTREFFELVKARLNDGGLFAVWLQGYSISEANFRLIVRTLAGVFPNVTIWEASPNDYALLASREPVRPKLGQVQRQFSLPSVRADLYRIGIGELHGVLSRLITGNAATREWCEADAKPDDVHTDDNARLEFSAPREIFRGEDLKTLGSLLARETPGVDEIVVVNRTDATAAALVERIRRAREARRLRLSIDELRRSGGAAGNVGLLALETYQRNPGSVDLHQRLREAASAMASGPEAASHEAILDAIRAQRPPTLASRTGQSLDAIADDLFVRGTESGAADVRGWAVRDLGEAHDLAPGRMDISVELVRAMLRHGQRDEAFRLLESIEAAVPRATSNPTPIGPDR